MFLLFCYASKCFMKAFFWGTTNCENKNLSFFLFVWDRDGKGWQASHKALTRISVYMKTSLKRLPSLLALSPGIALSSVEFKFSYIALKLKNQAWNLVFDKPGVSISPLVLFDVNAIKSSMWLNKWSLVLSRSDFKS